MPVHGNGCLYRAPKWLSFAVPVNLLTGDEHFILALANDYRQQAEQNLVIDPGDAREHARLIGELQIAGIAYQEVSLPFGIGPQPLLEPRLYARNGLLWATADGIGSIETEQRLVDTTTFSEALVTFASCLWVGY
jgi:hypothetical protein